MKGTRPLLIAVALVWAAVWLCTQTLPANPLSTGPTVAIGVAASLVAVWGYPSVIGPHRPRGLSTASIKSPRSDPRSPMGRAVPLLSESLADGAVFQTAALLLSITGGDAVEITDTETVLGSARSAAMAEQSVSAASLTQTVDATPAGERRLGAASIAAIEQGYSARHHEAGALVVASPLRVDDHIVGTLSVTFEGDESPALDHIDAIAQLLSLYMEVGDFTQQAQLAADARLDALRAQINPHFLFNTLNTIASRSRTDADEARQLLQRLADFFRYATQQEGQFAEFAHEYFFVRTYLSLEQARFTDRLEVHYDIDPQVLPIQVPVLVIQPLVENAVKHGIAPKPKGGTVTLRARVDPLASAIRITVRDNGIGMAPDLLADLDAGDYRSSTGGVGVRNIHERLEQLYGPRYQFDIRSSPGKGTRIELELPL